MGKQKKKNRRIDQQSWGNGGVKRGRCTLERTGQERWGATTASGFQEVQLPVQWSALQCQCLLPTRYSTFVATNPFNS